MRRLHGDTAMFARRLNLLRSTPFSRVAEDHPITSIDVGSRYGFEQDLDPIAFAVEGVGFEPDPEEFALLEQRLLRKGSGPWRSLRYLPVALSGTGGRRTLHIPTSHHSASLLEHDQRIGEAFQKMDMFRLEKILDVETMTLDAAAGKYAILQPSYLKIDIEGAELEVFASGDRVLDDILAIKTEISFLPLRHDQPLASDVDAFLRSRGFLLMDLMAPSRWRRGSFVAHPQLTKGPIPYSRGQLAHGDFLYFKDPDRIDHGEDSVPALLRAAVLAMAHGYFDHAAVLLEHPHVSRHLRVRYGIDAPSALKATSLAFGRVAWRTELVEHLRRVVTFARSAKHAAFG